MSPSPGWPSSTATGRAALTAAEVAQIAGRAGRGMRDGTFGTTADCPPLDDELVRRGREPQLRAAASSSAGATASSISAIVDALLASLTAPPPGPGLVRGNDATDLETLAALAREPEMRDLARGRPRVRLLWEACQIPDFRKLADDTHTRLCARVFGHSSRDGKLPTDWLAGQIAALARADGDIDTLMQRLSGVRVWSYIAARADWVPDAAHWQARAREVEDMLSDALHERLTARFVDRRAAHLMRRLEAGDGEELLSAVTRRGEVVVEGHPVGHVDGFGFVPDPLAEGDERKLVLRAARRALREEMPRRVAAAGGGAGRAPSPWLPSQRIAWDGAPIARLRPGASGAAPAGRGAGQRVPRRAAARAGAPAAAGASSTREVARDAGAAVRARRRRRAGPARCAGRCTGWSRSLGVVPGVDRGGRAAAAARPAEGAGRAGRAARAVHAGAAEAAAAAVVRALWALARGRAGAAPAGARRWSRWRRRRTGRPGLPRRWAGSMPGRCCCGWMSPSGSRPNWPGRAARGPVPLPADLASRLSVRAELLPAVLRRLGFRLLPAAALAAGRSTGRRRRPMMAPQRRGAPAATAGAAVRAGRARARSPRWPPAAADGAWPGHDRGPRLAAAGQMAVVRALHASAGRLRRAGGAGRPAHQPPADRQAACPAARRRRADPAAARAGARGRGAGAAARRGPAAEARLLYREIAAGSGSAEPQCSATLAATRNRRHTARLTADPACLQESAMTYVVTENCIKCKYMDCVEVCPVDCFYVGENMLVIHPDECIDCGVCEPECPAEAIVPDSDDRAAAWAGAEPHLRGAVAEHHPQGRAAGGCGRLEGQAGQGASCSRRSPARPER